MIKKNSINLINITYVMLLIFLVLNLLSINNNNINRSVDSFVLFTFLLIMCISLFEIIKDKTPYSLNKTFWYYNLIFNFFAPIIQYLTNYNMWSYKLESNLYLSTNIMLLFSFLIYKLVYKSELV